MDFPKIFDGCRTLVLERNYRSTAPILDLGNGVLENATERYEKTLYTEIEDEMKELAVRNRIDNDKLSRKGDDPAPNTKIGEDEYERDGFPSPR